MRLSGMRASELEEEDQQLLQYYNTGKLEHKLRSLTEIYGYGRYWNDDASHEDVVPPCFLACVSQQRNWASASKQKCQPQTWGRDLRLTSDCKQVGCRLRGDALRWCAFYSLSWHTMQCGCLQTVTWISHYRASRQQHIQWQKVSIATNCAISKNGCITSCCQLVCWRSHHAIR